MELSAQDLCFALEQRAHGEFPGSEPLDPRVPSNICEIPPSSPIDVAVQRAICGTAQSPGGVQTNVGQPQVAGGAQVIAGSVAYYPCPSPVPHWVRIRLAELAAGCCQPVQHDHHHHQSHGCGCGH